MSDIKYKMASLCFIFYIYCLNYLIYNSSNAFMINKSLLSNKNIINEIDKNRYNPFSKKYIEELSARKNNSETSLTIVKRYPLIKPSFYEEIRRLNSKNVTLQNEGILGLHNKPLYNGGSEKVKL